MRIKIFLLQLLIIVVLSSCGNKDSRDFNKLQTIDISDGFKKSKKIFLSEIATDINYIFLETKGEFLIRNADLIFFTDKNVFVLDESTPQILKFDLKGKFIQKIGNVGHGLGEFEDIFTATLCKEDETLTIYDGKQYKFIQYKYDGSLIKESQFENFHTVIHSLNKDSLLVGYSYPLYARYDNYAINILDRNKKIIGGLINRKWEGISKLDANMMNSHKFIKLQKFNDSLTFWEYLNDTVYRILSSKKVVPRYFVNYPNKQPKGFNINKAIGKYCFYTDFIETKDYLFFGDVNSETKKGMRFIYNKKTRDCYNMVFSHKLINYGIYNDLDCGWPLIPDKITEDGKLFSTFFPFELKRMSKEEPFVSLTTKFPDKQKELFSKINKAEITDNPVIMIVTLK